MTTGGFNLFTAPPHPPTPHPASGASIYYFFFIIPRDKASGLLFFLCHLECDLTRMEKGADVRGKKMIHGFIPLAFRGKNCS